MPKQWTDKEERQYEHIKDSVKKRGGSRAKEIAARTVNKQRRKQGKAAGSQSKGTGNPKTSLASRTRAELYNQAAKKKITGRSRMTKQQLLEALNG